MLEEKNDNLHEADLETMFAFNEMEATVMETETVKQTASNSNEDTVEAIEEVKPTDALVLETENLCHYDTMLKSEDETLKERHEIPMQIMILYRLKLWLS
jgi:phage regulator Rha-like protein